jgi:hypothetical protein
MKKSEGRKSLDNVSLTITLNQNKWPCFLLLFFWRKKVAGCAERNKCKLAGFIYIRRRKKVHSPILQPALPTLSPPDLLMEIYARTTMNFGKRVICLPYQKKSLSHVPVERNILYTVFRMPPIKMSSQ